MTTSTDTDGVESGRPNRDDASANGRGDNRDDNGEDRGATGQDSTPDLSMLASVSGAVAAAVALGVGELVSAFGRPEQSLVASVGNAVVDLSPGTFARFGIETFGAADKPALIIGIVALSLLIGAALGRATVRRRWVGGAGFAAFGLLGMWAGIDDPLANGSVAVGAAFFAASAGAITLYGLLMLAEGRVRVQGRPDAVGGDPVPIARPGDGTADRRAFFGWAGGLTAFAVVAGAAGQRLSDRSVAEKARAEVELRGPAADLPSGLEADLAELSPRITPTSDFYRIDTALIVPQVDPADWSLEFTGMVDRPYKIGYDELLEAATVEEEITLSCVSNQVGGDLVGNAVWLGVPLRDLLERAGVQEGATQIVGRSVDRFTVGFPTEAAFDGRAALVAVAMNGEPLPVVHGFPARLVVAGLYGYVSATKWLSTIELTTWDAFDAYWIPRGWAKEAPVKTQARIDTPRGVRSIPPGGRKVAGVAWAPTRGISRVELQVDDDPWLEAELGPATSDQTWVQWVAPWEATPGEHRLRVRATDGEGDTQTDRRSPPEPDGATGWHTITVDVSPD